MLKFLRHKRKPGDKIAISEHERTRLSGIPRYHRTETRVFDVPIIVNDTCTLLADIREIINGGIYKFQASTNSPLILDCGANIGMSVVYFKRLYPDSIVIAFEPDPLLFSILSNNISNFAFDNVELQQVAVWVNDEGVKFSCEGGHSGRISYPDDDDIVLVPSIRLKNFLESVDSVDMLKMDIEGAEADVLLDCGQMLKKCEYVFVEYHSHKDKKQELHHILELFADMKYRYHVCESFGRKHPFVDRNCVVDMDLQLNLFFIRE